MGPTLHQLAYDIEHDLGRAMLGEYRLQCKHMFARNAVSPFEFGIRDSKTITIKRFDVSLDEALNR